MIGYSLAGSTLRSSRSQWLHAYEPQKSSAHMKPPFCRYARSALASSSSKNVAPTSRDHHKRALEELGLGRLNDDVIRLS